jgi:hypothetical protein
MTIEKPDLAALRASAAADPEVPETVRNFLERGAPLEEIRLDAMGRWWHQGEVFENERLSALFHRSLRRTLAGTWILEIAPYSYPVLVDDVGRFAHKLRARDGVLWAERLDGGSEEVDPTAIVTDGEHFLGYRGADGALRRFVGDAWHDVSALIDGEPGSWTICVGEQRYPLVARGS